MDSIIVRICILAFCGLSAASVFLLWRNSAAPDALRNAGLLVAGMLPIVLSSFPYLKQLSDQESFTYGLIYDRHEKSLTDGLTPNRYQHRYLFMFSDVGKLPKEISGFSENELFFGNKGLNLLEKGIIEAMLKSFSYNWTSEPGAQAGRTVTRDDLAGFFPDNPFITNKEVILFPDTFVLPPGTEVSVSGHWSKSDDKQPAPFQRTIKLTNKFAVTTISIFPRGGGVQQQGVLGVVPKDPKDMNRYWMNNYVVTLNTEYSRWDTHSPEVKLIQQWHKNLASALRTFDMPEVEKDSREFLLEQVFTKVLGRDWGLGSKFWK